jgi:ParB family chromosome partitioning protein
MLQFMSAQSGTMQEIETLREKVRNFDGAMPLREIDPRQIVPSKWANRHAASFVDAEFLALKEEIRESGGVVQPIKVRPLPVLNGSTPGSTAGTQDTKYEVVFGHRRHRACLELGLPVHAVVEELTDQALFQQMERENRQRKNLSAWEQGCMYRQAIDAGLYPSLRKLAESIDVDVSLVSKAVALARLPDAVVSAFASPLDIQFRWAGPLSDLVQKDPEGLLARARDLHGAAGGRMTAAQVFAALTAPRAIETPQAREAGAEVFREGRKVAVLGVDRQGRDTLTFERGVLGEARRKELMQWLEGFLSRPADPSS